MNEVHEHIIEAELTTEQRGLVENLIKQHKLILEKYNSTTIKQFITKSPDKEDIRAIITLLKYIKHIGKGNELTREDQRELRATGTVAQKILENKLDVDHVEFFKNGFGMAEKGNQQWHVDEHGQPLYQQRYTKTYPMNKNGYGITTHGDPLYPKRNKITYQLVDKQGNEVIGPVADIITHKKTPHLFIVEKVAQTERDKKEFFLMDNQGNTRCGPYRSIAQFDEKTMRTFVEKTKDEWYLIDENGHEYFGPLKSYNANTANKDGHFEIFAKGPHGPNWIWIDKNGNRVEKKTR